MCAHKPLRSVILKCESQQNLSQLSCLEYAEGERTLTRHDGLLQGMVQNNWARWNFYNLAPQLSLLFTYVSTGWGESCLCFCWVIPREWSLLLMSYSRQCAWSCLFTLSSSYLHSYPPSFFLFSPTLPYLCLVVTFPILWMLGLDECHPSFLI